MKLPKLLLSILTLTTVSCWNVQVDHDPHQQDRAKMVAKQYLEAFFKGDKNAAIAVSTIPFFADGDLFESQSVYEKELLKELSRKKPLSVEILNMSFHTIQDLKAFNRRIYRRLVSKGFNVDDKVYLVAAFIKINKRNDQGFLLLKQHDNQWKVVGILD